MAIWKINNYFFEHFFFNSETMPIPSVARFSRQRREHFIKETNNNNVKSNVVGPSGDFRKNVKVINNNNNF